MLCIISTVHDALNPVAFLVPSVLKIILRLFERLVIGTGGVKPQALTIRLSSESKTVIKIVY